MGDDLKKGVRSIKEVVTFDEEEITDDILQNRLKEFTGKKARGWLGQGLTETWETLDILAEEGIECVSD